MNPNLDFEREGEQQMQFSLLRQPLIIPRKGNSHLLLALLI